MTRRIGGKKKNEVGAGRYQPQTIIDKVNQQMADKNLIGGKYTVYLHLLQVFWQKSAK
jgi:hypothetical protein